MDYGWAMTTSYDIIVVGGGIAGLWAAKRCADAGFRVLLCEKDRCGSGASGGPLGALLPHLPDTTSPKRIFQWAALHSLSDLIREIEAETGLTTGYQRCGRLTPVRRQTFLPRARASSEHSAFAWAFDARAYAVEVFQPEDVAQWMPPSAAPYGVVFDTMSAKVAPPMYIAALRAAVAKRVDIRETCEVMSWDGQRGRATTRCGDMIIAQRMIVAAGVGSFPLLAQATGLTYGQGVKGQAVVLEHTVPGDHPILYDDGVYIVPHVGRCAVGSTSQPTFQDPTAIEDAKLEPVLERAATLMPALGDATRRTAWAGVRPRAAAKDPMVGCLDPDRSLYVLTGGYKVTFGIAHRLAEALLDELMGREDSVRLPDTYRANYHASQAQAEMP
ncbi:MAG: FAD-dependent oxidoreductase [Pseudomonadota bacterium]